MGDTWRRCWRSRTGNRCCHLRGLSNRRLEKRLPGRMSVNARCSIQAVGARLWSKQHERINPSCFLSAVKAGGVCFLAHSRPLTDSWLSFSSVRLQVLVLKWPPLVYQSSLWVPLGRGGTGDMHGHTADGATLSWQNERRISGGRF